VTSHSSIATAGETRRTAPYSRWPASIAVLAALCVTSLALVVASYHPELTLAALLNASLFAFLAWQCILEFRKSGSIALLSPAVLASVFHFSGSYVLPFLMIPLDDAVIGNTQRWVPAGDNAMLLTEAMGLANAAAVAFWVGYRLRTAIRLGTTASRALRSSGFVRFTLQINVPVALVSTAATLAAILISIRLGVFGYSSNYNDLFSNAEYRQLLSTVQVFLPLNLFLFSYDAFCRLGRGRPTGWRLPMVGALFLLNVGVGFLSGFKAQVAFPALIVAGSYYLASRKIPVIPLLLAIPLLWGAYRVIEPFRALWNNSEHFDSTNLSSITSALADATTTSETAIPIIGGVGQAATKVELLSFTAATIEALRNNPEITVDGPNFLNAILLAPVYMLVPRAVWPGKPIYQFGYWYAQTILGDPIGMRNSVAMGPISYFLFIHGSLAVVVGFMFLGGLFRAIFEALSHAGPGAWLVYLMASPTMFFIYSEVGPSITGMFMTILSGLVIQRLVLER
jgi:hypothetical protein